MEKNIKLFAFEDEKNLKSYERLGFKIEMDDEVNKIYYAEWDLKDFDLLGIYALLEDCERFNISPILQIGESNYSVEEGLEYINNKL
jgi:hypothetical protein